MRDFMKTVKGLVLFLAVCGSILFAIREAGSCSVPVFRYALERWKPDPYKGVFIYRGTLSAKDQALIQQLEAITANTQNPFNLRIRAVEVAAFGKERLLGILKTPIPEKLPVLAIWYPDQMGKVAPFWMQEVTSTDLQALADSPKRQQLTESLINGESVIWVFVPSGNSRKDENAQNVLRRELDRAADNLAKAPSYDAPGSEGKKLRYSFPILTLSRSESTERFFLDMLLQSGSHTSEHKDEPIVFPVFGRGRMFGGLSGEQINEKNIQGIVSYLAASCSCEVKAQHPGMDLLLSAFWDRVVMGELFVNDDAIPQLTGVMPESSKPIGAMEEATENPAPPEAPASPQNHTSVWKIYGITLGSTILVVVFAGMILNRRRKENR
jgi:hypothetical protein